NVIAEIKGSVYPDEIILVGGHLDSWDIGDGSHDDGAGIVQSMDVVNILKNIGYKPKRTIRVVLFMNEENGTRGAKKYFEVSKRNNLNHIFALESDAGGFTPRGFSFTSNAENFSVIKNWKYLFDPYLIQSFVIGGSGADISLLKTNNNVLAGLRPDSQRYFDYHHAASDTFDAINKRELELGTFSMTSLIYLFDKYGINN
ncbi:MAG: M20/M25/M40 family metallo-hydrolase, partial [Flavobacteriaceae bacterium]|nr:M20/M25/M40 family metallo-hydrolase [Flavobacteriaceae bacterium]